MGIGMVTQVSSSTPADATTRSLYDVNAIPTNIISQIDF